MKARVTIILMLASLALVLAAGCAKKKTAAQPQAVVIEDTTPPAPETKYEPMQGAVDEEQLKMEQAMQELATPIHFDFDKSDIRAGMDRERLQNKSVILQRYTQVRVTVEGNCDERGTNEYNMALGSRRANSAKEYLKVLGVDPSRIDTVSYGEERPVDPGHNEEAWAKNRRDDFVVHR